MVHADAVIVVWSHTSCTHTHTHHRRGHTHPVKPGGREIVWRSQLCECGFRGYRCVGVVEAVEGAEAAAVGEELLQTDGRKLIQQLTLIGDTLAAATSRESRLLKGRGKVTEKSLL